MMSLGDDKIRCVAQFCETDSDCSSSIDSDEEKCRILNTGRKVTYTSSEISFLIGFSSNIYLSKAARRN